MLTKELKKNGGKSYYRIGETWRWGGLILWNRKCLNDAFKENYSHVVNEV